MNTLLRAARAHGRQRHNLISQEIPSALAQPMTIPELRAHFQTAVEIEHSTLPTYMCALYSMDAEKNQFAYQVIQSVLMEEMLHMIQAANILTAIGGRPELNNPKFIPEYPTPLPHSDESFIVPLQKFSKEALDVFLRIELPKGKCAPPQGQNYHTIGQFYMALRDNLIYWNEKDKDALFTGKPEWQITSDHYYGGGGKLLAIHNLHDALEAIYEIVGQGEGIDGGIVDTDHRLFGEEFEYAHYFRFNEVRQERRYRAEDTPRTGPTGPKVEVDWNAVANMKKNPKLKDYPVGSPLWKMTMECNRVYMRILDTIQVACTGAPDKIQQAIPLMYELKYQVKALMNVPLNDEHGQYAGPSFEYVPL